MSALDPRVVALADAARYQAVGVDAAAEIAAVDGVDTFYRAAGPVDAPPTP